MKGTLAFLQFLQGVAMMMCVWICSQIQTVYANYTSSEAPHQVLSLALKCLTTDPPNNIHSIRSDRNFPFFFSPYLFKGSLLFENWVHRKFLRNNPIRHLELIGTDEVTIDIFHLEVWHRLAISFKLPSPICYSMFS